MKPGRRSGRRFKAYLNREPLDDEQIAAIRAYLRQWIMAGWLDDAVEKLRADVGGLTSRQAIAQWLGEALEIGIDPL